MFYNLYRYIYLTEYFVIELFKNILTHLIKTKEQHYWPYNKNDTRMETGNVYILIYKNYSLIFYAEMKCVLYIHELNTSTNIIFIKE